MTNEQAIKTLKKLKSFHNGSYGTAIDEAIKALEQESITWIVGKDNCQVAVRNMPIDKMKKICAVIGEEEQQPCEDCVSRENALNGLIATDLKGWQLAVALEAIEKLSPVTPQPKTGEWIDKGYDIGNCWATCSECDGDARGYAKDTGWGHDYYFPKFCPHCGARMNGGGEDAE